MRARVKRLEVEEAPAQFIRKLTARDLIELLERDRDTTAENVEFIVQLCARALCKEGGELIYNGSADSLLDQPLDLLQEIAEEVQRWSGWSQEAEADAGKEQEIPVGSSSA